MLSSVRRLNMEADPANPSEPTRAEDIVMHLSERLAITANARTVYGEPVHSHERTIIPVAKFGWGLGATSRRPQRRKCRRWRRWRRSRRKARRLHRDHRRGDEVRGLLYAAPAPGCRSCRNRSRLCARAFAPIGKSRVKPRAVDRKCKLLRINKLTRSASRRGLSLNLLK